MSLGRDPSEPTVVIVLTTLRAEGTPQLALDLACQWRQQGIAITVVVLFDTPDDLAAEFAALDVSIRVLNWPHAGRWRYLGLATTIWRLCRQVRPVGVLSMPFGWHAFMAWGAYFAGVDRFITHIGNAPGPLRGARFDKFNIEVHLGRWVTTRHVCCSAYVRDRVIQHFGLGEREMAVVHNGVRIARFADIGGRAADDTARADVPVRIGMVATLEHHKDQPTLITAGKILRDRGVKPMVCLAGEGSRRPELAAMIDEHDLGSIVELLGARRDISELLHSFDIFAFATTPDEGQGIALVEAMAARVPVVASDVGACREVLNDGECGVLVTAGDPEAMADGIQFVIEHPERRAAMVEAAYVRAQAEFSVEQMARAYLRLLGVSPTLSA